MIYREESIEGLHSRIVQLERENLRLKRLCSYAVQYILSMTDKWLDGPSVNDSSKEFHREYSSFSIELGNIPKPENLPELAEKHRYINYIDVSGKSVESIKSLIEKIKKSNGL